MCKSIQHTHPTHKSIEEDVGEYEGNKLSIKMKKKNEQKKRKIMKTLSKLPI